MSSLSGRSVTCKVGASDGGAKSFCASAALVGGQRMQHRRASGPTAAYMSLRSNCRLLLWTQ